MNDKEYTYDIDKYTIGVDENGEDGIGLTVAKVENGEIHFLGNCYGENARCLDLLIKENKVKEINKNAKHQQDLIQHEEGMCRTICCGTHGSTPHLLKTQLNDLRIRKLTPLECFRLMGVKDEDYYKVAKNQSNSSLYHLAGDSIVVNVLMAIFKELIK